MCLNCVSALYFCHIVHRYTKITLQLFAAINSPFPHLMLTLAGCDVSGFEDFAADSSGSPSDE